MPGILCNLQNAHHECTDWDDKLADLFNVYKKTIIKKRILLTNNYTKIQKLLDKYINYSTPVQIKPKFKLLKVNLHGEIDRSMKVQEHSTETDLTKVWRQEKNLFETTHYTRALFY